MTNTQTPTTKDYSLIKEVQMTKKKLSEKALDDQVQILVDYIYRYDSDTFFARGNNVTWSEARIMASWIIGRALNDMDGVTLDDILESIRNGEANK